MLAISLLNSYAWDTAIDFLQKCDDRENKSIPYSLQTSLNTGSLSEKGTSNDVICNIYDMASNCREWTTETGSPAAYPCVARGGYYVNSDGFAAYRNSHSLSDSNDYASFRPLLYL